VPRRKTISDESLLDGAMRVLTAGGPGAFTLSAVAAEAGLAPATLIQRYGSKRSLLLATLRHGNDRLRGELASIERAADAEPLVRLLTQLASGLGDRATLADNIALLSEDLRDPDLAAIAAERTGLLRLAAERLLPPAILSPPEAARLVEAQWHGAIIQAALSGADVPVTVEHNLRALLSVLLAGATAVEDPAAVP
jgi:AcrR family transcriptional regulator